MNSAAQITGIFSLLAFVAATAAQGYRARLTSQQKMLEAMNGADKLAALQIILENFHVNTAGLPVEAQERIAREQIKSRRHRMNLVLVAALVIGLLLAVIAIGYFYLK